MHGESVKFNSVLYLEVHVSSWRLDIPPRFL